VRWIGFKTIVIREYGRIVRIWGQTLVPSAVTATLYFVIFGNLIGRRVGAMAGFDYRQYLAPGLIMMSIITNSYGNVVSSFFGAKFGKHVEELLVSPLPNWIIVAGYAWPGASVARHHGRARGDAWSRWCSRASRSCTLRPSSPRRC
jgi:ABC-2 type transport system permease protein